MCLSVLQNLVEEVLRTIGAGVDVAEELLFLCLLYTSDAADE